MMLARMPVPTLVGQAVRYPSFGENVKVMYFPR